MFSDTPHASGAFVPRAAAAMIAYIYQRLTEAAENDVVRAWNNLFADRNP
jgi:hypothetical protein